MKLNHINLTTTDPTATAEFLVTYFGLRNEGGNQGFVLVRDDDDMVITVMKAKKVEYPSTFHIGFYPETEAEVDDLHRRLTADGFRSPRPSGTTAIPFTSRRRAVSTWKSPPETRRVTTP